MTELLVKLFVKNSDEVSNRRVRTSYGVLSSVVGMVCNTVLFAVKFLVGFLINSISVMTDAFNNLSDTASSIIGFFGVRLACRPADKEHPFGHGRYEYIAALAVSFIIIQIGLTQLKNSFDKILNPDKVIFNPILTGVLCLSVFIKLWMMLFNRKLGKRINSTVMMATAADSLGDVMITSVTIISTIIAGLTGWQIDGYMGLVVSIFVMYAGVRIAKGTLEPLLGQAVDREAYEVITNMVESYEGIVGTHDLIIHSYGPSNKMATIHAEVPNDIDFEKAHETIDRIERDVLEKLDILLVIHMDPVEVNNVMVLEKKEMVTSIIKKYEPSASIHDFRILNGELHTDLIFDIVLPYSYSHESEQGLMKSIIDDIRKQDSRYNCVITLDKSFIADK